MRMQGAIPDVERLVVDEQADYLAIGDIDDGLTGLREAVACLRVRQRPDLIKGVQIQGLNCRGLGLSV